jgi:hypothetical protein
MTPHGCPEVVSVRAENGEVKPGKVAERDALPWYDRLNDEEARRNLEVRLPKAEKTPDSAPLALRF